MSIVRFVCMSVFFSLLSFFRECLALSFGTSNLCAQNNKYISISRVGPYIKFSQLSDFCSNNTYANIIDNCCESLSSTKCAAVFLFFTRPISHSKNNNIFFPFLFSFSVCASPLSHCTHSYNNVFCHFGPNENNEKCRQPVWHENTTKVCDCKKGVSSSSTLNILMPLAISAHYRMCKNKHTRRHPL